MNVFGGITPLKKEQELVEINSFQWEISLKDMLSTHTAVFCATIRDGPKFFFDIRFQRKNKGSMIEYASLQVILKKFPESSIHSELRFTLHISVHFSDGCLYRDYNAILFEELAKFTERTCIDTFSKICDGLGEVEVEKLSSTNKLVLKCQISFLGHIISPQSLYNNMEALQSLKTLMKNSEALYQSKELSDVIIKIGENTYKSHKFVLAAHSPVFKTMLMQDFQEAKTGVIAISDFEPDVFECFLKFLYTGELGDKSISNVKQLYILAYKYDVQILRQECFKLLTDSNLNEDQIDDVLHMAYQYNDNNLKKAAKQLLLAAIK